MDYKEYNHKLHAYAKQAMSSILKGIYSHPQSLLLFEKNATENKQGQTVEKEVVDLSFKIAKLMLDQEDKKQLGQPIKS